MIPHPSDNILAGFAAGELNDLQMDEVGSHIQNCSHCAERVEQLSPIKGGVFLESPTHDHIDHTLDAALADSSADTTHDSLNESTTSDHSGTNPAYSNFGDYELIEEIARGGMGVVYKARQQSLNRIVALKMIKSGEFANQEQVERFYVEAEAGASLDHPGIVPVHEVGEIHEQHYFTMGFVDGESLSSRLANGPLPPKEAARYAKSIAEAVAYAHSKGVIHRDLKPGNVLITKDGILRITDFGLAKRIEEGSELTTTGQLLGTPSYMPPEQAAGKVHAIGPAADIYAIGSTLYCMLSGRPPFQAANLVETLKQVIEVDPASLSTLNRSVPQDLETLCLKCLEKIPGNRYQSANDVVDELQCFLNDEPILARPVGRLERSWRWCKRRPAMATLLALMFVLAVGGPALSVRLILSNRQTAVARVDALLNATPAAIPVFLNELDRDSSLVQTRLKELSHAKLSDSQRLRLSLALLPSDPTQLHYLQQRIQDCSYEELQVVLERIGNDRGRTFAPVLWDTFRNLEVPAEHRFRVGISLAVVDSESNNWKDKDFEFLVNSMLQEVSVYQPAIRRSLRPIADRLIEHVKTVFVSKNSGETVQESAASTVIDFAGEDLELLTELSMIATEKQYRIIFPPVARSAEGDVSIAGKMITVTKLEPGTELTESQRVDLGKRRSGAALSLIRLGHLDEALKVLRVEGDPEALTQFVHGSKARGITVTELLELLNRAKGITERYGILLALGEFPVQAIPTDVRSIWVKHVMDLYTNDPSSGIHGASGWLLREWGFVQEAKQIEERTVPYDPKREWFTLELNLDWRGPKGYFTFVVFSPGDYEIGSPLDERDRDSVDEDRREVKITRSFAMLDREVTRREFEVVNQFQGFLNERSWMASPDSAMAAPDWYMSVDFCRLLTAIRDLSEENQAYMDPNDYDGPRDTRSYFVQNPPENWPLRHDTSGFRLPTEAEWEIACRGGMDTAFCFGSDRTHIRHYGWDDINSTNRGHHIRELRPNLRGLFDMHGNVWEWCHDWSGDITDDVLVDPIGPAKGKSRVIRGGGYDAHPSNCRSSSRIDGQPTYAGTERGFRVTFTLDD